MATLPSRGLPDCFSITVGPTGLVFWQQNICAKSQRDRRNIWEGIWTWAQQNCEIRHWLEQEVKKKLKGKGYEMPEVTNYRPKMYSRKQFCLTLEHLNPRQDESQEAGDRGPRAGAKGPSEQVWLRTMQSTPQVSWGGDTSIFSLRNSRPSGSELEKCDPWSLKHGGSVRGTIHTWFRTPGNGWFSFKG